MPSILCKLLYYVVLNARGLNDYRKRHQVFETILFISFKNHVVVRKVTLFLLMVVQMLTLLVFFVTILFYFHTMLYIVVLMGGF